MHRIVTLFLDQMEQELRSEKVLINNRYGGYSLLDAAIIYENFPMVKLLLSFKPDLDAGDLFGMTPLARAAIMQAWDIAALLLECGAKVDAKITYKVKNKNILAKDCTPLHTVLLDSRVSVESVEFLLKKGADPDAVITRETLETNFNEYSQACDEYEEYTEEELETSEQQLLPACDEDEDGWNDDITTHKAVNVKVYNSEECEEDWEDLEETEEHRYVDERSKTQSEAQETIEENQDDVGVGSFTALDIAALHKLDEAEQQKIIQVLKNYKAQTYHDRYYTLKDEPSIFFKI